MAPLSGKFISGRSASSKVVLPPPGKNGDSKPLLVRNKGRGCVLAEAFRRAPGGGDPPTCRGLASGAPATFQTFQGRLGNPVLRGKIFFQSNKYVITNSLHHLWSVGGTDVQTCKNFYEFI